MQETVQKLKAWWSGFRWSRLSRAAQLEIAFWAVVAGGLFFLFHLHGNSQEIATCRRSLFLWLRSRWNGDYAYGMFLPLASLAALWMRRREIAAAPRRPDVRGVLVVVAALGLHWLGVLAQQPRISVAGLIFLTAPDYMRPLFTDPRGHIMLMIGAFWMTLGVLSMRKMINFRL